VSVQEPSEITSEKVLQESVRSTHFSAFSKWDDGLYLCLFMPVATTILSDNESHTFLKPFASIARLEPNLVLIYDLTDFQRHACGLCAVRFRWL
jgi:hypothetical protein